MLKEELMKYRFATIIVNIGLLAAFLGGKPFPRRW